MLIARKENSVHFKFQPRIPKLCCITCTSDPNDSYLKTIEILDGRLAGVPTSITVGKCAKKHQNLHEARAFKVCAASKLDERCHPRGAHFPQDRQAPFDGHIVPTPCPFASSVNLLTFIPSGFCYTPTRRWQLLCEEAAARISNASVVAVFLLCRRVATR